MKQIRESSIEAWNEVKPTMKERAAPIKELFRQFPESTVDEIKLLFERRYRPIARNELAKTISYLSEVSDELINLGRKKCTVTRKNLHYWKLNPTPIRGSKKKPNDIIKELQERVKYLEGLLKSNNIDFTTNEQQFNLF